MEKDPRLVQLTLTSKYPTSSNSSHSTKHHVANSMSGFSYDAGMRREVNTYADANADVNPYQSVTAAILNMPEEREHRESVSSQASNPGMITDASDSGPEVDGEEDSGYINSSNQLWDSFWAAKSVQSTRERAHYPALTESSAAYAAVSKPFDISPHPRGSGRTNSPKLNTTHIVSSSTESVGSEAIEWPLPPSGFRPLAQSPPKHQSPPRRSRQLCSAEYSAAPLSSDTASMCPLRPTLSSTLTSTTYCTSSAPPRSSSLQFGGDTWPVQGASPKRSLMCRPEIPSAFFGQHSVPITPPLDVCFEESATETCKPTPRISSHSSLNGMRNTATFRPFEDPRPHPKPPQQASQPVAPQEQRLGSVCEGGPSDEVMNRRSKANSLSKSVSTPNFKKALRPRTAPIVPPPPPTSGPFLPLLSTSPPTSPQHPVPSPVFATLKSFRSSVSLRRKASCAGEPLPPVPKLNCSFDGMSTAGNSNNTSPVTASATSAVTCATTPMTPPPNVSVWEESDEEEEEDTNKWGLSRILHRRGHSKEDTNSSNYQKNSLSTRVRDSRDSGFVSASSSIGSFGQSASELFKTVSRKGSEAGLSKMLGRGRRSKA